MPSKLVLTKENLVLTDKIEGFLQRQQLLRLIKGLTEMRLTTILLGELPEESIDYQRFGP